MKKLQVLKHVIKQMKDKLEAGKNYFQNTYQKTIGYKIYKLNKKKINNLIRNVQNVRATNSAKIQ